MKSKTILIVVIVVVVVVIVGIVTFKLVGGPGGISLGGNVPSGGAQENSMVPLAQIYPNAPTGQYLPIGTPNGTVQVNNFYAFAAGVVEGGAIVIKATPDYWFTYDPSLGSFWIAVSSTPFTTVRQAAEQDFVGTLGVSQADACKLNVQVGTPYSPGNPLNGQSFPLSFCSSIP